MSNRYLVKIAEWDKEASVTGEAAKQTFKEFAGSMARRTGRALTGAADIMGKGVHHLTGENVHTAIRENTKIPVKSWTGKDVSIVNRPESELHKYRGMKDSEVLKSLEESHGKGSDAYQETAKAMNRRNAVRVGAYTVGAAGVAHYVNKKMDEAALNKQYQQMYGQSAY